MEQSFNIKYLPHHEIDKSKWDECIDEAENGLIYAYSFYLDHMAKHWDALVMNDYEIVMPLTWNKKSGIYYLYQPAFTANLGVFGKNINENVIEKFIQFIPKKFKLIEISLNYKNNFNHHHSFVSSCDNYILPLNASYENIYKNYRENHQRNIQKALQAGCLVKKNISAEEIIQLNKQQLKNLVPIPGDDYEKFKQLYHYLSAQNKAVIYAVTDPQNKLLASCIFFFSHKRAYYILVGNDPNGRNIGASHALIDTFIKDNAGKEIILDFEGSDIESLAKFYSGFGATKEIYPAIRWNKLPWYLKWAKR